MSVVDPTHDVVALGSISAFVFFVVALVAAWFARLQPGLASVVLLAAAPFDLARYLGPTTITTEKAALVGVAVGLLLHDGVRRELRALRRVPLAWCALGVIVATAITQFGALSHAAVLRETLKAAQYALTFALVFAAARADRDDTPVLCAIPALAIVVSAAALAQLVTGAPAGLWIHDVPIPRIAGPLEGPNQLAGYLGLLLPLVLLTPRSRIGRIALVLGSMALVLSLSRSGIAASAIALACALVWLGPETRRAALAYLIAGFTAGGAAVFGLGVLLLRVNASGSGSSGVLGHLISTTEIHDSGGVGTRSELWRGAVTLWRRRPLLGIGAGNFELLVGTVTRAGIRTHSNSWYLQSLVEGGIPLLAATLANAWFATVDLVRAARERPIVAAIAAASIGLCLHQIADFLVFYTKVGSTWWILLGLAAARAARD